MTSIQGYFQKSTVIILSFLLATGSSPKAFADVVLYNPGDALPMQEQSYDPNMANAGTPLDLSQEDVNSIDFMISSSPLFSSGDDVLSSPDEEYYDTADYYDTEPTVETNEYYEVDYYDSEPTEETDPYYDVDYYDTEPTDETENYYDVDYYDTENETTDMVVPVIVFRSPIDLSLVFDEIMINVDFSDNQMLTEAEIYFDDVLIRSTSFSDSSGNISFSYNTRLLENGIHTLKAVVYDEAGNSTTETITVEFDNMLEDTEKPNMIIRSPIVNQQISGQLNVEVDLNDNEGLHEVIILFQGQTIYTETFSGETEKTVLTSLNTRTLPNGAKMLQVILFDVNGNQNTQTLQVTTQNIIPDTLKPSLSFITPTNYSVVSGTRNFSWNVSDNKALKDLKIYVGNTLISTKALSGMASVVNHSFDTTQFSNGSYTIKAVVRDEADNVETQTIEIEVDNPIEDIESPTILVHTPSESQIVSGQMAINVSATDNQALSKIEIRINDRLIHEERLSFEQEDHIFDFDTTSLEDGDYPVEVIVYDEAGNNASQFIRIKIENNDNTVPSLLFISPTDGETVYEVVNVRVNYSDNEGVDTVELLINGVSHEIKTVNALSGTATFPIDTRALGLSNFTLKAIVTDLSGNQTEEIIFVEAYNPDLEAPTFTFLEPAKGSTVSEIVTIRVEAHDNENIAEAILIVNGFEMESQFPNFKDGILTFTVETRDNYYFEDSLEITVILRDDMYNEVSHTINVAVNNPDLTAPTLTVNSLHNGMTINGYVDIDFYVEDNKALQNYVIKMDGEIVHSEGLSSNYDYRSFFLDTTSYADGDHNIQIIVTDASGNETVSDTFGVIVDNPDVTAPTVNFISPTNGQNVSEKFNVTIQATDNEILTTAVFKIDGIQVDLKTLNASNETIIFPVSSRDYNNGLHTFSVTVTDESGNETFQSIQLNINNPDIQAPTFSITSPANNATISEFVNIHFIASDDRTLTSAELFINNTLVSSKTLSGSTGNFQFSAFNSRNYENGIISVKIILKDSTGNQTEQQINLNINNSDIEVPGVSFVNPIDGETVSEVVNVRVNYSDNEGVDSVELLINGVSHEIKNVNNISGTASFPIDTRALGLSSFTLKTIVTDLSGNQTEETIFVEAYNPDLEAPTFAFLEPANGSTVSETVTIRVEAHDNENISEAILVVNGFELDTQYPSFKDGILTFTLETRDSYYFEGSLEITVILRDDMYNEVSHTINVAVNNPDITAPTLSVRSPYNDMTLEGSMDIDFSAEDNDALQSFQILMNGNIVHTQALSSTYEDVYLSFDTTPFANGNYDIQIVVTDASGNENVSDTFGVIVDNPDVAAPTVNFISPTNGQNVSENFNVTIQATDNEILTNAVFKINGIQVDSKTLNASNETIIFPVSSRDFSNGLHTFYVTVTDESGNETFQSIQLNINNPDILAPVLAFVSPANGGTVSEMIDVKLNTSDDRGLKDMKLLINGVLVNSKSLSGNSDNISFPVNTRHYPNGNTALTAIVTDETGNETFQSIQLNINNPDILAPTLAFASPANGATVSEMIDVKLNTSDDRVLKDMKLLINGVLVNSKSLSGNSDNISFPINTRDYPNGNISLTAIVTDETGNETSKIITLTIANPDIQAPALAFVSPANGATVSEMIDVKLNTSDDRVLKDMKLLINGVLVNSKSLSGNSDNISFPINTRDYPNGNISLTAIVTDETGNETIKTMTIIVKNADILAPEIKFISPSEDSTLIKRFDLEIELKDNEELAQLTVFVGGRLVKLQRLNGTEKIMKFSVDVSSFPNGDYPIKVVMTDKAGNKSQKSLPIKVQNYIPDAIKPTITLSNKQSGDTLRGNTTLEIALNDNVTLSKAKISLGGLILNTSNLSGQTANLSIPIDTTRYFNGTYVLEIIAWDERGNEERKLISFVVNN